MTRRILTAMGALLLALSVLSPRVATGSTERTAVLISFRTAPTATDLALVHGWGGHVSRQFHIVPAVAATIPEPAIAALRANPRVAVVEPDSPLYALEYDESYDWGVVHIGAQTVHVTGQTGSGVRVATIDSGIDCAHVELIGNCDYGWNYVSNTSDANDDYGHGTHVAGIIGAALDGTAQGVVGVAPGATVIAYKTLDSSGVGSWSRHIAAIEDIWNNGSPTADIVNMSIGRGSYSSVAEAAMLRAYESGIVLVAAAGNSGRCNGKGTNLTYPALFDSVIAVAATDATDTRPCWSSTGSQVELAAPGVSVFSTWPMATSYLDPQPICQDLDGNGTPESCYYKYGSGTSMSSPHVAGVAALLIGSGQITDADGQYGIANEVRQRLDDSARDIGPAGRDPLYGYGLVDAVAAMTATGGGGNVAPVARDDSATTSEGTDVTVDILANDSDANGDLLSVANLGDPAGGSVVANANGTVTYRPDAGFTGTDTFTYQAFDGSLASNVATVTVTVTAAPPPGGISLSVSGSKVRGLLQARLSWSGATSAEVDVFRDDAYLVTTANDGAYTDDTGQRGGGSFTYQVCESGTTTCSNSVTVSF